MERVGRVERVEAEAADFRSWTRDCSSPIYSDPLQLVQLQVWVLFCHGLRYGVYDDVSGVVRLSFFFRA